MSLFKRLNLLVAGLLVFGGTQADAQAVCPVPTTRADEVIERLLTGPEHADTRQEYGVGAVSAADIRKLADSNDATTCQRLHEVLRSLSKTGTVNPSDWRPAFYSAGGLLYMVADPNAEPVTRLPSGNLRIRHFWIPTYIVDPTTYAVIAGIAM